MILKLAKLWILTIAIIIGLLPLTKKNDPNRDAEKILRSCYDQNRPTDCFATELSDLTKKYDLAYSFSVLNKIQATDNQASDCHFIAHSIAAVAVSKNPSGWREILNKKCPSTCSYGCSHGALEAYYTQSASSLAELRLANLCDKDSPPACPHGLGHLLLVETRGDLHQAIDFCDNLPPDKDQRYQCLTGIFMELVTPTNLFAHGIIVTTSPAVSRINELTKTCQKLTGLAAWSCWKEVSPPILEKNLFNPQTILSYCPTLPDPPSQSECQQRMIDTIAWKENYDLTQLSKVCPISQEPEFTKFCLTKLVASVAENTPQQVSALITFCLSQDVSFQTDCLGQIRPSLGKTDYQNLAVLIEVCGKLSVLSETCRKGYGYDFKPYLRDL